ncbi:hypothetical protein JKP88DRAFT_268774 [Tribonema minus]|uniref:GCF C-terminal domain-containing protein n=1 Tax=Tribonema minus TaxID=303371 RepID=A0A835YVY7_9STRA|nr:hypothetical protein JKP88DRAFT_268774 [Tribonema minus]
MAQQESQQLLGLHQGTYDVDTSSLRSWRVTALVLGAVGCLLAVPLVLFTSRSAASKGNVTKGLPVKVLLGWYGARPAGIASPNLNTIPNKDGSKTLVALSFAQDMAGDGNYAMYSGFDVKPSDIQANSQLEYIIALAGSADTPQAKWRDPADAASYVNNAVATLSTLITTYHAKGTDINYEGAENNNWGNFAGVMCDIISGLRQQGASVITTSPFSGTKAQYAALHRTCDDRVDYINYQIYAGSDQQKDLDAAANTLNVNKIAVGFCTKKAGRRGWKHSTAGLYTKEALAQLRSSQASIVGPAAAAAAADEMDVDDIHTDSYAALQQHMSANGDHAETSGAVFTGEEAAFVQEYGEKGGALDSPTTIARHMQQHSEARTQQQQQLVPAAAAAGKNGTRAGAAENFIPFDVDTPVPGAGAASTLRSVLGRQMELDDGGGARGEDDEAQAKWEMDVATRGAAAAPPPGAAALRAAAAAAPPDAAISVAELKRALDTAAAALRQASERGARQLAAADAELAAARRAAAEASAGAAAAGRLFETFQSIRARLGDVCGMLRAKEGMVAQLEAARDAIGADAAARARRHRREAQEADVADVRRSAPGAVESLGDYEPLPDGPLERLRSGGGGAAPAPRPRRKRQRPRDATFDAWVQDHALRESLASDAESSSEGDEEGGGSGGSAAAPAAAATRARVAALLDAAALVLEDVDEDVRSLPALKALFEGWKRDHGEHYARAYCALSLPPLLAPLVRLEMLRWDPVHGTVRGGDAGAAAAADEEVDTVFERFAWFRCLFDFAEGIATPAAAEYATDEDPDADLVPKLLEAAAVPQLAAAIESAYDAGSAAATAHLVAAAKELLFFPLSAAAAARLAAAPLPPLRAAAAALCVPVVGPLAARGGGVALAARRLWHAARLYHNAAAWDGVAAAAALVPIAIGEVAARRAAPALERLLRGRAPPAAAVRAVVPVIERFAALTPVAWRSCPGYADAVRPLLEAAAMANDALAGPAGAEESAEERAGLRLRATAALEALRPC